MYIDYFLKFPDQTTADSILYSEESYLHGDTVEIVKKPKYIAIDVIGTIYKPTGNIEIIDNQEVPEMVAVTGYHVNVRHESEAPELQEFVVNPKTPTRVWF